MALRIDITGQLETLPGPLSLEDLQKAVDGYIEPLTLAFLRAERTILLVNEDGLALGFALNSLASHLAQRPIVGPAVLCTCLHPGTDQEEWR